MSERNIAGLGRTISLTQGDYQSLLEGYEIPSDHAIIVFVAPPWGTALDEVRGLDLRRTDPPITEVIGRIGRIFPRRKILFATQVYEKVNPDALSELQTMLDWSELRVYDLIDAGRNHGILLGTKGWNP